MKTREKVKRNKSSFCVMPILDIKRDELYWDFFFINCYIGCKDFLEFKNHFFLLFNFNNVNAYTTVKEKLTKHKLFTKEIAHSTKTTTYNIFVFTIPKEHSENVALFKEGKYSKLSREYKNIICKVHKVTQAKPLFHILHKTKKRRMQLTEELNYDIPPEVELWSMPNMDEEILNLTNLP